MRAEQYDQTDLRQPITGLRIDTKRQRAGQREILQFDSYVRSYSYRVGQKCQRNGQYRKVEATRRTPKYLDLLLACRGQLASIKLGMEPQMLNALLY